jgi:hypothetical protein
MPRCLSCASEAQSPNLEFMRKTLGSFCRISGLGSFRQVETARNPQWRRHFSLSIWAMPACASTRPSARTADFIHCEQCVLEIVAAHILRQKITPSALRLSALGVADCVDEFGVLRDVIGFVLPNLRSGVKVSVISELTAPPLKSRKSIIS